jgi:hypothetical protein
MRRVADSTRPGTFGWGSRFTVHRHERWTRVLKEGCRDMVALC